MLLRGRSPLFPVCQDAAVVCIIIAFNLEYAARFLRPDVQNVWHFRRYLFPACQSPYSCNKSL